MTALVALTGAFVLEAARAWLSSEWVSSTNVKWLVRARRAAPDNAVAWHRLGRVQMWDLEQTDLSQAIFDFQTATRLNPHYDRFWLDLAEANETAGDVKQARAAFERAQSAHPVSAEVAWRFGNFLLRRGDSTAAYTEFRRALEWSPDLAWQTVAECWKASPNADRIFAEALPPSADVQLSAVQYFVGQNQLDAALSGWNHAVALGQVFSIQRAFNLMDALIGQDRVADAERVWQQALRASGMPDDTNRHGSLVFDGGFENRPVNGGFGWRMDELAGASFGVDTRVAHSGARSLRISFDGSANLDFRHLSQFVPVQPAHRYHFSAFLRTDGISTDSGMRFAIYDPVHPAVPQILTPDMVGTQPWSPIVVDFVTGPQTRLVVIALRRIPSWKFDNKLRGTVWVDDVALVPVFPEKDSSP